MSDSQNVKLELLRGLISKNVNLSDLELAELTGFPLQTVQEIKNDTLQPMLQAQPSSAPGNAPFWDYVLAFDVGSKDPKHKIKPKKKDLKNKPEDDDDPEWQEGMDQDKYFGQTFNNIWRRLEAARLSVQAYTTYGPEDHEQAGDDQKQGWTSVQDQEDKENKACLMFLIVGITEQNLKAWADERDTDILIDPVGGVHVGRSRNFPLANRTKLNFDANDITTTLDLSNWEFMYGKYSQHANQKVYKHYKRSPGIDDTIETVFDERTRLRIIYESIITDTNEGGAEIRIAECLKNKKHPLRAVFPLHNEAKLEYFNDQWIKAKSPTKWMWCPLKEIRDYFGEPVAFYFAFLQFYLRWLIAPAITGLIFFVWQVIVGEVAVGGISLLGFFLIFWSVAFVDFWARAECRYRVQWGMTKFQQKAVARPQFQGEWQHDVVTGVWTEVFPLLHRTCRVSAIYTFVTIWVSCCVVSVVYILLQRDKDPNNLGLKIMLGVGNGIMIFIFDIIYKVVSVYGNEWENHRTEEDFQNAYIYKSFVFKFVNSFASLFYLGFIRPLQNGPYYYIHFYDKVCGDAPGYMSQFLSKYDTTNPDYEWYVENVEEGMDHYAECLDAATEKSCIKLVMDKENMNQAWAVALDGFYPAIANDCPTNSMEIGGRSYNSDGKCYGVCDVTATKIEENEVVLQELRIQLLTLFFTAIIIQNTLEVGIPLLIQYFRHKKDEKAHREVHVIEEQARKQVYANTIDDMSELIIQFGYVTLFVMAFPLTPLLAIVNNIIEMKVDGTNLVKSSQRPHPNGSFGLGSWNGILSFFSIISVGTNVALITWRTKLPTMLLEGNESAEWIFFSALSILLGIIVAIEKWAIPDVPLAVEQAIERQRLVESVLVMGAGVDNVSDEPPDPDDDDGNIQFDPSLMYIDFTVLPRLPQQPPGN